MKKTTLSLLAACFILLATGQVTEKQKMIELGKVYKDFMFRNEPPKEVLKEIQSDVPETLTAATAFIAQTITTKNKLLTQPFLSRPDDKVLKQIYLIRAISLNLGEENQVDSHQLIDSLLSKDIPVYELVDSYYEMFFNAVGNKNQPFDLSKTDFKMKEYNFKDDTEKGIMFLQCMDLCGTTIWGYMNVVRPPNTGKAYSYIKKFPKFNGQPYYQYTDLYFPEFEMVIRDKGVEGYKSYYLDKYYATLLTHLICLKSEGGSAKEKNDLLLGSVLKERNLYKYTKHRDTLESIFKEK